MLKQYNKLAKSTSSSTASHGIWSGEVRIQRSEKTTKYFPISTWKKPQHSVRTKSAATKNKRVNQIFRNFSKKIMSLKKISKKLI